MNSDLSALRKYLPASGRADGAELKGEFRQRRDSQGVVELRLDSCQRLKGGRERLRRLLGVLEGAENNPTRGIREYKILDKSCVFVVWLRTIQFLESGEMLMTGFDRV